jgi:hypothetical protein
MMEREHPKQNPVKTSCKKVKKNYNSGILSALTFAPNPSEEN